MPSCHHQQTNNNNLNEGLKENHNKIRKRNCSSSSSSSLVRRYRFKRAILVGKKGGSSTPVPMWKTTTTSPPSMATTQQHLHHPQQLTKPLHSSSASGLPSKDKELSVSARKLAATLWEINDLPPSRVKKDFEVDQMRSLYWFIGSGIKLCASLLCVLIVQRMKGFDGDSCSEKWSTVNFAVYW